LANGTGAGWRKYGSNPVLGGMLGSCFDLCVLSEEGSYKMYFSWRPQKSVALAESRDGVSWSKPVIVLPAREESGWENEVNRPVVVKRDELYHMWFTGQVEGDHPNAKSWIGYASSKDGRNWKRRDMPVLVPNQSWELKDVMCPHVIWDDEHGLFKMWYSGGEQYEPDAIGYAVSADGIDWVKPTNGPVFRSDPLIPWERHKVTGCQIIKRAFDYLMFYVGFEDIDTARIGIARSADGISAWERFPANPIIGPGIEGWDEDACYKPWAIEEEGRWILWYNGRRGHLEQIGVAYHEGEDLGY